MEDFKELVNTIVEMELTNEVFESSAHHSCTLPDELTTEEQLRNQLSILLMIFPESTSLLQNKTNEGVQQIEQIRPFKKITSGGLY